MDQAASTPNYAIAQPQTAQKPRVLIVEDVHDSIRLLMAALKNDFETSYVTTGEEALLLINSALPPDLVLLDVCLPNMGGYDVLKQIKAHKRTENIPVIFITANHNEEDETRGFQYGAVDYITKPFSIPIVLARIRSHIAIKQHHDELEQRSYLDALTGIPNRRRFDETLKRERERALREQLPISLIMIDVDYFKIYNDRFGHFCGDECLRQIAHCLHQSTNRPGDICARYGGEEFAVILHDTPLIGAIVVAERMRLAVEALSVSSKAIEAPVRLTISLGIATAIPTPEISPEVIIGAADKQLYLAKHRGRNQLRGMDLNAG